MPAQVKTMMEEVRSTRGKALDTYDEDDKAMKDNFGGADQYLEVLNANPEIFQQAGPVGTMPA